MLDEAKTGKDALSDELGSGTTSGKKSKQTSKEEAKGEVLTPEVKQKLISDAKAEEGRKWKRVETERDQLKEEVGTLTDRLDTLEVGQRTRAYEEARSDPSGNALRTVQAEESVREREKKLQVRENEQTRKQAQLVADRELFATESGETMVSVVAAKHGVDEKRLAGLGITDKIALDKVAADMKANTPETKPLTAEQETAKKETEDKGDTYSPTDETPSGAKPVELTAEGVENADMAALQQVLTPPIK